jgi:ribosome biogenesis protein SSF1/2
MLDLTPPLVVLHNFNNFEESHIKLMRTTFQHMFPSISVKTVKLTECRRVVLFHYHSEVDQVEIRHYAIRALPTGISKSVKRILQSNIPNLSNLEVYVVIIITIIISD